MDFSLPGLGLELTGGVNLAAGFDFNVGFGVNKTQGVLLDTSALNDLQFKIEATLPNTTLTVAWDR